MLTRIAQEELNKIKPAVQKIDEYHFMISRSEPVVLELIEEHFYLIRLEDYITHPSENFTLSSNWNGGIVPASTYMVVQLKQRMGKMLKFDGIGYNLDTNTYKEDSYKGLWLPNGGIELLKELKREEL